MNASQVKTLEAEYDVMVFASSFNAPVTKVRVRPLYADSVVDNATVSEAIRVELDPVAATSPWTVVPSFSENADTPVVEALTCTRLALTVAGIFTSVIAPSASWSAPMLSVANLADVMASAAMASAPIAPVAIEAAVMASSANLAAVIASSLITVEVIASRCEGPRSYTTSSQGNIAGNGYSGS